MVILILVLLILLLIEVSSILYFTYVEKKPLAAPTVHGVCTICGAKAARWARPGVCLNCKDAK